MNRSIAQKRLEEEAQKAAESLIKMGAKAVILFGSVAEKRAWSQSDLDFFVVFQSPMKQKELMKWLYQNYNFPTNCGIDLLAANIEQFLNSIERPFIKYLLRDGIIMHDEIGLSDKAAEIKSRSIANGTGKSRREKMA